MCGIFLSILEMLHCEYRFVCGPNSYFLMAGVILWRAIESASVCVRVCLSDFCANVVSRVADAPNMSLNPITSPDIGDLAMRVLVDRVSDGLAGTSMELTGSKIRCKVARLLHFHAS